MPTNQEIAARVKETLAKRGVRQGDLAAQIGLSPDQISRALSGQRGFSSVELAAAAKILAVDVNWLITGEEDPLRIRVAARHAFDAVTGTRSVPGRAADEGTLESIALAYRQAYPLAERPSAAFPPTAGATRDVLGDDFVRAFADRVEGCLDVDVVRVQDLSTAYSFTVGGRHVVVLPSTPNWFWSNFALAHELAHLALGHHDVTGEDETNEAPANAFAADLLLPASVVRSIAWADASGPNLARFLWQTGVSTTTLANRLSSLRIGVADEVRSLLGQNTVRVLRRHEAAIDEQSVQPRKFARPVDPISSRMQASSGRRFPATLVAAQRAAVEEGRIAPATLAWMLESPVEDLLDVRPPEMSGSIDDLLADFAE
ncbi:helix-turn-helix domain-containing protein [Nocardioides sp. NPDC058538]|uniref:helix-turn-helix domain-containing protein n=1 Tax=Nocardioides sp. NPDC058538 TaxID=3346542 RepID=UPI00365D3AA2